MAPLDPTSEQRLTDTNKAPTVGQLLPHLTFLQEDLQAGYDGPHSVAKSSVVNRGKRLTIRYPASEEEN